MIVAKFGGSSLADAGQFEKVRAIVESNPERKYIVPSAPGKRGPGDDKITDLLYACQTAAKQGRPFKHILERIEGRYDDIIRELGLDFSLNEEFAAIEQALRQGADRD